MATVENLIYPLTEDGFKVSRELAIQPLMRDQIARYKLIASDDDDPSRTDLAGKHLKKTPGYMMAGKKVIYDPISQREVTIMTPPMTKKFKGKGGMEFVTQIPKPVRFLSDKPVIEVHWNQPELYAFMELADENIDNPRRNKRKKAFYYRVDARKKLSREIEKDAFELEALNWIAKTATYTELKACAEYVNSKRPDIKIKTNYPDSEATHGYEMIKRELYALAKKDPHTVLKGSTRTDAQAKMQLIDAEGLGVIMFFDSKSSKMPDMVNSWFHNNSDGLKKICTVDVGKNKHDALLDFIVKDKSGKDHYEKIVMMIDKFLKPQ